MIYVSNGPVKEPVQEPAPEPDTPPTGDPELSGRPTQPEENNPPANKETTATITVDIPTNIKSNVSVEMNGALVSALKEYDPANGNPVNISITGPAGTTQTVDVYVNGVHEAKRVTFPES